MPDASSAAEQAAASLMPEGRLLADADPVLFGKALGQAATGAARRPVPVLRAFTRWATALAKGGAVAAGRVFGDTTEAPLEAARGDRRWADPAWDANFAFFGLRQAYLATAQLLDDLVAVAELPGVTGQKAALATRLISDALAPTNFLPTNPTALKRAFETGGLSVARGAANWIDDLAHNNGRPRQVDSTPFALGENLAATAGVVVFRNDLMELIQYAPQTQQTHRIPLLCSPPWINKYYIMDLAPGRSFIEWAVQHGHTVFAISYRNPDATMRDVSMDDYLLQGPRQALDVIADITGEERVNIVGLCLGGALTAMLTAYLHAIDDDRINSITLLNTLLDYRDPGPLGAFTDPETIERLEAKMATRGYLEGSEMAGTFDALRANDLIFNYVATNWLMGEAPPAFDILAWNADSTRMPAAMHAFYLRSCYLDNELASGALELAGQRLSLKDVACDTFIVAAENDHIAPWRSSYRSTQLIGGDVTFVLTSSGHIAGVVNPPGPKSRHWLADETPADPDHWREQAVEHRASWWEPWATWIAERAGSLGPPPPLGTDRHPATGPAPGSYVRQRPGDGRD